MAPADVTLRDSTILKEPTEGDIPGNVMDWFAKQTRPGTNLRSTDEAYDEDLLGGGEFGKIYLKSLRRQAEDEALSMTQRQALVRTMGEDSIKRTSPKSMPASRALQFRNRPPKQGGTIYHQRKLTLDNITKKPNTAAFTARPIDRDKVFGQKITGLNVGPLMGISQFNNFQNSLI